MASAAIGPLLIGIGHRKRVGKDYLARLLQKSFIRQGAGVVAISHFSYAMKTFASSVFGMYGIMKPEVYDEHPGLKRMPCPALGKTPRELWIEFGNTLRAIFPDVWVDLLDARLTATTPDVVIIPDVRFQNEVDYIRRRGGILIKVDAPTVAREADGADDVLEEFTGWDYEIANDFQPKTLIRAAEDLSDNIKERQNGKVS